MTNMNYDATNAWLTARRQQADRRLAQAGLSIQALAQRADGLRLEAARAARELFEFLQLQAETLNVPAWRVALYGLVYLSLAAIYVLDYLLIGAVAEYFASRMSQDPLVIACAKLIVPLGIVIIELMIAGHRRHARELAQEYGDQQPLKVWRGLTLLLLVVMPAMVLATNLAALPNEMSLLWLTTNLAQMVALVALSLCAHGLVLYGGHLLFEASAYFAARGRAWWKHRRQRALERQHEATRNACLRAWLMREQARATYRVEFGQEPLAAPFDALTNSVLGQDNSGTTSSLPALVPDNEAPVIAAPRTS